MNLYLNKFVSRAENSKAELECNRVEEDNLTSHDQLKKENSIIESKKRMLEQSIKSLEQLRSQTEKTRSELKQYNNHLTFSAAFLSFVMNYYLFVSDVSLRKTNEKFIRIN